MIRYRPVAMLLASLFVTACAARAEDQLLDRHQLDRERRQHPVAVGALENPRTVRAGEFRQRGLLGMARVALLGALVDHVVYFSRVGRKADEAFLVEDANAPDAGLLRRGEHHLLDERAGAGAAEVVVGVLQSSAT